LGYVHNFDILTNNRRKAAENIGWGTFDFAGQKSGSAKTFWPFREPRADQEIHGLEVCRMDLQRAGWAGRLC